MNYGLIAIFDNDFDYANSLADYFRLKGGISSEIVVFTRLSCFEEYAVNHSFDILLINHEFISMLQIDITSLEQNLFVLCEQNTLYEDNKWFYLFKYTSAEELLRQVMANYKPVLSGVAIPYINSTKQKSKLIGIYSPIHRCGKTSLAMALAMKFSLTNSCLFLSFDDFSALENILFDNINTDKGLDDLLYYFTQSTELLCSKLLSVVRKFQHLDFVSPSTGSCALGELDITDRISFIQALIDMDRYDYIFLDMGNTSPIYPVLQLCCKIYVPTLENDAFSDLKINNFMASISNITSDKRISLEKISLPVISINNCHSDYIYTLTSGEMAQLVTSLTNTTNI